MAVIKPPVPAVQGTRRYRYIEPEYLLDAAGGDPELFRHLLGIFIRTCPPMLEDLEQSSREGRQADAAKHAHSLKTSVALVGAEEAASFVERIEHAAMRGQLDTDDAADIAGLRALLLAVFAEVEECLSASAKLPGNGGCGQVRADSARQR